MVTAAIAASARTLRRRRVAPPARARVTLSPEEARLLTLRRPQDVPSGHAAPQSIETSTRAAPPRPRRRRRLYGGLLFWATVAIVWGGGYLLVDRGGRAAPLSPAAPAPSSASAVGSGRVTLPVHAGDSVVRVSVEPAHAADGWFWCFESDRGLPPERHYCSSTGVRDPATGYLTSNGVVHVDPGAWSDGTTFYVQLYCPGDCRWRAEVSPAPSGSATLP